MSKHSPRLYRALTQAGRIQKENAECNNRLGKMQTILALTDLSQLGQDHVPGPSFCINDSKQGAGKLQHFVLVLSQPDCCVCLLDKHNFCY